MFSKNELKDTWAKFSKKEKIAIAATLALTAAAVVAPNESRFADAQKSTKDSFCVLVCN